MFDAFISTNLQIDIWRLPIYKPKTAKASPARPAPANWTLFKFAAPGVSLGAEPEPSSVFEPVSSGLFESDPVPDGLFPEEGEAPPVGLALPEVLVAAFDAAAGAERVWLLGKNLA